MVAVLSTWKLLRSRQFARGIGLVMMIFGSALVEAGVEEATMAKSVMQMWCVYWEMKN